MSHSKKQYPNNLHWHIDDIAYEQIDTALVSQDEALMFMVAAASFIERASDEYTGQLVQHFSDHAEIHQWLDDTWQYDEVQHGTSLAKYVTTVWPDFEWDKAYERFMDEYRDSCDKEHYEEERGLEMLSRCVVEMGASSSYFSIREHCQEPILKDLIERIRKDEIRHYKYFLGYFKEYMAKTHTSRFKVIRAIFRRLNMMKNEDSVMGLQHVFKERYPDESLDSEHYQALLKQVTHIVQSNLPMATAIRMVLTPLDLPKWLQKWVEKPLIAYAKRFAVS